jgi:hypothetical protein
MGWRNSLRPFAFGVQAFGVQAFGVQEWVTGTDGVFRRLINDGR